MVKHCNLLPIRPYGWVFCCVPARGSCCMLLQHLCVRRQPMHSTLPGIRNGRFTPISRVYKLGLAFLQSCSVVHVALLFLDANMSTAELRMPRCLQVVRVAVLSLKNLLADEKLQLGPDMVEAGLPKVVQQRSNQVGKGLFFD